MTRKKLTGLDRRVAAARAARRAAASGRGSAGRRAAAARTVAASAAAASAPSGARAPTRNTATAHLQKTDLNTRSLEKPGKTLQRFQLLS
jgi:hypothetical protein